MPAGQELNSKTHARHTCCKVGVLHCSFVDYGSCSINRQPFPVQAYTDTSILGHWPRGQLPLLGPEIFGFFHRLTAALILQLSCSLCCGVSGDCPAV